MNMRVFTEAEVKAVGGLSKRDRRIPHLDEIMEIAVKSSPAFTEAVKNGIGVSRWWELCKEAVGRLREANSETALGFLLRKGVQSEANNWYNLAERQWQNYAMRAGSNGVAEWYAPLYNTSIPTEVPRGGRFPEAPVQGEDSSLRNKKFGQIVAFDRELFDDDQTGQIASYSRKLGEGMGVTESVYTSSRFIGNARTYGALIVPASTYTTTDINAATVTGPFSSTLYGSAVGNRAQTFGALNLGRLSEAYVTLMNAVDPLKNKIIVNADTLLVSSMDALHGETLLKPGPWPAVIGPSNVAAATNAVLGGTSATAGASQGVLAGFPGGWNSPNPFGGMGWKLVVERYLPDWACALGQSGRGFVMQIRDPLEISEEAKNAGSYFEFDTIRYRSRERFEADWVGGGSRFWYEINDGSVSGNH